MLKGRLIVGKKWPFVHFIQIISEFEATFCYMLSFLYHQGTKVMLWGTLPSCTEDTEIRDTDLEIECFR